MLKPINYLDKNTDFSASDFCQPTYFLWIKKRKDAYKNAEKDEVFSPAFVGSLIHKAHEECNEINVIKEFSTIKKHPRLPYTIGGTIDRLEIDSKNGQVTICDLKSGGQYPMLKKFKDNGSDEWMIQLSIYRWLIKDMFNVESYGKIYAYVLGHQKNKDNMPMVWNIDVELNDIDNLIDDKIIIATSDNEPECDCPKWKCESYCDYSQYCKDRELYKINPKEFS